MDEIHIARFKEDNPDALFPSYRSLDDAEREKLVGDLCVKLRLPKTTKSVHLDFAIYGGLCFDDQPLACHDAPKKFHLAQYCAERHLTPGTLLLISRQAFGSNVDEMKFQDVVNYFQYLRLEISEDITLVDPQLRWLIEVDHDGWTGWRKFA